MVNSTLPNLPQSPRTKPILRYVHNLYKPCRHHIFPLLTAKSKANPFLQSEVANALSIPGTLYGGVTGTDLPLALHKAREVIRELNWVEAVAEKTIAKLRVRADELQERRDLLAACLPTVEARRERGLLATCLPVVEPQNERDDLEKDQHEGDQLAAHQSTVEPHHEKDHSEGDQPEKAQPTARQPTAEPEHDKDQPTACLPAVEVGHEGDQRAGRIRAFAAESLRDLRADVELKTKAVAEMKSVFENGTKVVEELEAEIEKICKSVGLQDYQELFAEFDKEMMEVHG